MVKTVWKMDPCLRPEARTRPSRPFSPLLPGFGNFFITFSKTMGHPQTAKRVGLPIVNTCLSPICVSQSNTRRPSQRSGSLVFGPELLFIMISETSFLLNPVFPNLCLVDITNHHGSRRTVTRNPKGKLGFRQLQKHSFLDKITGSAS